MISNFFKTKLTPEKLNAVTQVAINLGIDPNWLLGVMYFETGKTFSPAKTNSIGSVGLIQFTRDRAGVNYKTINGKKYLLSELGKMSFVEQMKVVEQYYKEVIRITGTTPASFVDTYLVTFFPTAINKTDDYVFQTKGLSASLIAKQNQFFDSNKDFQVTKKEVTDMFKKWYGTAFKEIDVKKKVLTQCSHCKTSYYL